jgi:hypothetical protein
MKPLTLRRTLRLSWCARWHATATVVLPVYFLTSVVPIDQLLAQTSTQEPVQQHPAVVLTPQKVHLNKQRPQGTVYEGVQLSDQPTDQEVTSSHAFVEPLVPLGGKTTSAQNVALSAAIKTYLNRKQNEDVSALTGFLDSNATSPWRVSLELNLADAYYKNGAFSKALATWQDAWIQSKDLTDARGEQVGNLAAAKLAKMDSRLGRVADLDALFGQFKGRQAFGAAAEILSQARGSLSFMKQYPDKGYRCGPNALQAILVAGHGIPNLIKYALNLDPTKNASQGLPIAVVSPPINGQNYLTLSYTEVPNATDISYVIQVSSDLINWSSGSLATAQVSSTPNDHGTATVVVRDLIPITSSARRFIRLQITQP